MEKNQRQGRGQDQAKLPFESSDRRGAFGHAERAKELERRIKAIRRARGLAQPTLPLRGTVRHPGAGGVRLGRRVPEWRIDERTRATSRSGLAAARATLAATTRRESGDGSGVNAA
ncbi:MAG: hypothetical protein ACRDV4_07890 [Acidimicrobiales bacterium]